MANRLSKTRLLRHVAVSCLCAFSVASCNMAKENKPKTPLIGERTPILMTENGVEIDSGLASVPVTVPDAFLNDTWEQPGGNAEKSMGHLELGKATKRLWQAHIGGGSTRARMASGPVISDGRLYVVDTHAHLYAFDADSGKLLWKKMVGDGHDIIKNIPTGDEDEEPLPAPNRSDKQAYALWERAEKIRIKNKKPRRGSSNSAALFGGGVSVDGDRLFATSGIGDVAAFDAKTGKQLWVKRPGGPVRGAPGVGLGNVYVISRDNQIFALSEDTGELKWSDAATLETTAIFGAAAPSIAHGTVIAGFSSGELSAYRYENGYEVWQDALSRTSISTTVGSLSDINAFPVIDSGHVYAVGQGGRMVAVDLFMGQRLWELNISGFSTPWVVGQWIFVVTMDAKLLAIQRSNGHIRWMSELKAWANPSKKTGPINWNGPVLAGGRLILTNNRGELIEVDPADGQMISRRRLGLPMVVTPVVARNNLYLLGENGQLQAWH
ncbi:PQQ-like beta-propeller repeat protein [Zymomonas mobilis]|uniref:Pyrrolo-quinoline quinone n=1 Tax=Zymomonas mobilis subsp. mobilis (strain ATCC 10988 / DSM 424 / LMG 404 / NCIMB 8938 / NRRL B-806 / ZM1) TaxID=555217 RepID=A0A0H3FYP6_ZYMMA|nr:PQQ-like beta-propeller repeat protein [Zymomonas mobilis]AEH62819.1 Pyrrolo-quinoline quinone [Zymomonas mobilis subsp. mobilis ATCC 10988]MCP9307136.1 PQQ-binding-like beta-propeller repeat protein [Zymomonas mobilis]TQL27575.1 outer membrane protein assembly factor BamB [Zymomonas mobilis]TQL29517.1 outer membrane protein assembly factor BamB [Zymomonas mobilis]